MAPASSRAAQTQQPLPSPLAALAPPEHTLQLGASDDAELLHMPARASQAGWGRLVSIGATWLRVYVSNDPKSIRERTAGWNRQIVGARRTGLKVIVTVASRPKRARTLTRFVRRLATRWKGGVAAWSVINEPQLMGYFSTPCRYRKLWLRARNAIRKVDPAAPMLMGELSPQGGIEYLARVMQCSPKPITVEGVSVHPYQFTKPPRVGMDDLVEPYGRSLGIGRLPDLNALLRSPYSRLRAPDGGVPPVWITEFGYLTRGVVGVREGRAAGWWRGAIRIACQQGVSVIVAHAISEELRFGGGGWDTSLFRGDGSPRAAVAAIERSPRTCAPTPGLGATLDVAALFSLSASPGEPDRRPDSAGERNTRVRSAPGHRR